jgi:hypothetical protein
MLLPLPCWLVVGTAAAVATGAQVTLSFSSLQIGTQQTPGSDVHWQIVCIDTQDNLGLAGISVDMLHDATNHATFDLSPATNWPSRMACFSRPEGISNAGPGGSGTGYGGTPVGPAGSKDLVEIGGMQNAFGFAGILMGHDHTINTDIDGDRGIGQQSQGQIIAEGDFIVPLAPGVYRFYLENGMANVFVSFGNTPSDPSTVAPAEVAYGGPLWFVVGNCCEADFNGDGDSGTDADIEAFFACMAGSCCATCGPADYNCDGDSATDADIESFFRVIAGGPC